MTAAPERGPRWLEYVPLDELRPDPRNPKNHRLDTLRESVVRWGYSEPVQVDERTGLIVSGHGRRELLLDDRAAGRAAPEGVVVDGAGGWLVPVVRGWASADDDEAFGYLVAANRIGEQGGWLTERLLAGLEPLAAKGPDMLAGVGYTPDDLSGLLALLQAEQGPSVAAGGSDPDEVPEPPPNPVSRRGDLWLCGPDHRVLCGDATVPADVEQVMDGAKADVLLTDPPYGIDLDTDYRPMVGPKTARLGPNGSQVAAKLYRPVFGDDEPFDAQPVRAIFASTAEQFWFGANYYRRTLSESDMDGSWLVWDKRNEASDAGFGSGFELIWSARPHKQDLLRYFFFGAFGAEARHRMHPTQKPSALLAEILNRWSPAGAIVADPFAGSGSTLIACHSTGRKARLIEKDEHYADVICRRYQEFTGDVPVLESSGEPHDFCTEPASAQPAI